MNSLIVNMLLNHSVHGSTLASRAAPYLYLRQRDPFGLKGQPERETTIVMRRLTVERGMSLVEATIILMTLAILTAVLAPTINDYVEDARRVKAKEDVEVIGISIARLLKDTGFPFMVEDATVASADRFKMANRADLAAGSGNIPVVQGGVDDSKAADANAVQGAVSWTGVISDVDGRVSLYDQLVANKPTYTNPGTSIDSANPSSPGALGAFGLGYRGAYLSGVVTPDPWGFRYVCSTVFLGSATDATSTNGGAATGWADDAKCLSAGRNNQIETNFDNAAGATNFSGSQNDDVLMVVTGFGR